MKRKAQEVRTVLPLEETRTDPGHEPDRNWPIHADGAEVGHISTEYHSNDVGICTAYYYYTVQSYTVWTRDGLDREFSVWIKKVDRWNGCGTHTRPWGGRAWRMEEGLDSNGNPCYPSAHSALAAAKRYARTAPAVEEEQA